MLPNFHAICAHFPVLLSTVIRSRFQVKPATPRDPIGFILILLVEEFYGARNKRGSS